VGEGVGGAKGEDQGMQACKQARVHMEAQDAHAAQALHLPFTSSQQS